MLANNGDPDQKPRSVSSDLVQHCLPMSHKKDADVLTVVKPIGVYLLDIFCSSFQFYLLLSHYLCFISFLYLDLYVLGDDALIS